MEKDVKIKRAVFIDRTTSIREQFSFADPKQVMQAVALYCCDYYGSMLWNLFSDSTAKYFRCWNTCTKLAWGCPRSTHTYFVPNLLAQGIVSTRTAILSRYVKFVQNLLTSPSPEVVAVANSAVNDRGSTTGANLFKMHEMTGLNPLVTNGTEVMKVLLDSEQSMPANEKWRIKFLEKLLWTKQQRELYVEDTNDIDILISTLCSS